MEAVLDRDGMEGGRFKLPLACPRPARTKLKIHERLGFDGP